VNQNAAEVLPHSEIASTCFSGCNVDQCRQTIQIVPPRLYAFIEKCNAKNSNVTSIKSRAVRTEPLRNDEFSPDF
jgi:hypothetical protein